MRRTRGRTLADGVVYLLDLIEERVAAGGEDMDGAPGSQVASGCSPRAAAR
jgi:hypothetical protein